MLETLKLATVRKVAPQMRFDRVEGRARSRDAAGGDHASLRRRDELRHVAEGRMRRRDRGAARTRHARHVDLPSLRRVKRWLASDEHGR